MKSIIEYYYNLKNIRNYKNKKNKISFNSEEGSYTLEPSNNKDNILYIYQNFNGDQYDKIVLNIHNSIFTNIKGIDYVLIQHIHKTDNIYNSIIRNKKYVKNDNFLDRTNWIDLWCKKLDYYEYQQKHIKEHSFIQESFNYYLGMGETAISYIKYNFNNKNMPKVISHKRIKESDFNNPLNLIVDYRSRDISEYLKYLFFSNRYKNFNFNNFFSRLNFNRDEYILLYGRLLFPCFYFDVYDDIINNDLKQKEILNIISRSDEYEKYVNMLYIQINSIIKIPKINWL